MSFPDDPVLHLPMDGNANEEVQGFNFTNNGATTTSGYDGTTGEALKFKSSENDNLVANNLSWNDLENSSVCVTVWINSRNEPQNTTEFRFVDGNGTRNLNVHIPWGNGNIYWDVGSDSSGSYGRITTSLDNKFYTNWYFYCFYYDASTDEARIYVDDMASTYHTGSVTQEINSIEEIYIGSGGSGNYKDMDMEELRVYNRTLSENERKELKNSRTAGQNFQKNLSETLNLQTNNKPAFLRRTTTLEKQNKTLKQSRDNKTASNTSKTLKTSKTTKQNKTERQ